MKYNIISILFLLLLFPVIQAQEVNIPILVNIDKSTENIDVSVEKEKVIVHDGYLTDSLKVIFMVKVIFKYPLKDISRCVIVDSVELVRMNVSSFDGKKTIIDFGYNEKNGTEYQKNLWNILSKRIKAWYLDQPYNKMIDRGMWDRIVGFGGVVFFVPKL